LNLWGEITDGPDVWQQPASGIFYHPHRLGDTNRQQLLELVRSMVCPMPVTVTKATGYLSTMRRDDDAIIVQLLAEDYDVDIDHTLDSIRTHRSRVNLLTDIAPVGVDGDIRIQTDKIPTVYTPFNQEDATVTQENGTWHIQLPENCSYALLCFQ